MKCEEIRELMPDLAAELSEATPEMTAHLESCAGCAGKLKEFQQTMSLLDEWKAPEPSPYFDVRLQARLREEMTKPQLGWFAWLRRPALAAALTVLMAVGVGLVMRNDGGRHGNNVVAQNEGPVAVGPGTAVGDLQSLENNHDLYSDFDLLDDVQVQQDVVENP
ncbi:MAG TPA: hypothetical protein VND65_12085 [Candidatus Binatia bacterium]|nr:hypothetical protein [Candidatus Binatia bacterium]